MNHRIRFFSACFFLSFLVSCTVAALQPISRQSGETPPPEPGKVSLVGKLPAEIPLHKAKTGHLMVTPKIDGREVGGFIFDTGAGMSCMDSAEVKRLNLPDAGETSAKGSGGETATHFRRIKSLELGPVLIEDSAVVDLDLRAIGLAMREPLGGIIGYECFLPAIYEIDLDAGKLVVHDPAKFTLPEKAEWQKLQIIDRRPFIKGKIEENEEGLFLLDTGATGSITVHSPAVKKFKLLEGRETKGSVFGGVGGMNAARTGILKKVTIAGQELTDVPATFSQTDKGAMADDQFQGTIGVDTLKQSRLFVDYKNERVAMVKK